MALTLKVHPQNPQPRLLRQASRVLRAGSIVAVPTDSGYALVCRLHDNAATKQLRRIQGSEDKRPMIVLCPGLSGVASCARIDNRQYRVLKLGMPGPFTFILEATGIVPRRARCRSCRTVGVRVPDHRVLQAILETFGQPLLAAALTSPNTGEPSNAFDLVAAARRHMVDLIVDAGDCPMLPATVIDMCSSEPVLVRRGFGDPAQLGLSFLAEG